VTDHTSRDIAAPTAGWHPDPTGRFAHRWWDGHAWTDHVHPHGAHPQAGATNFNLPTGAGVAAPQQILIANASKSPGLAVAALVLGVGAFFFSLIPGFGFTSIPFAITGLALGIAGLARAKKGYEGKGLSTAGVVASAAALLVSLLYLAAIGDAYDDQSDGYYGAGASELVVDAGV
jgi:uncharacterized membrane protein